MSDIRHDFIVNLTKLTFAQMVNQYITITELILEDQTTSEDAGFFAIQLNVVAAVGLMLHGLKFTEAVKVQREVAKARLGLPAA